MREMFQPTSQPLEKNVLLRHKKEVLSMVVGFPQRQNGQHIYVRSGTSDMTLHFILALLAENCAKNYPLLTSWYSNDAYHCVVPNLSCFCTAQWKKNCTGKSCELQFQLLHVCWIKKQAGASLELALLFRKHKRLCFPSLLAQLPSSNLKWSRLFLQEKSFSIWIHFNETCAKEAKLLLFGAASNKTTCCIQTTFRMMLTKAK